MKKWVIKATVQKGIAVFPFKHKINYLFQKYITKGVQLSDEYFEDRLIHYANHQQAFLMFEKSMKGKKVAELGTGWYPVVPVCFFLNGVASMVTMDIASLMDRNKLIQTVQKFQEYAEKGKLNTFVSYDAQKLKELVLFCQSESLTFESLLQKMNLTYEIGDATQLALKESSFDLIVSNNTFEHVYPTALKKLLLQFKKWLKPKGVMSHFVDMSDHFAHLDKTITIYNFLRFTEKQWSWIDNTIQPQNRWRIYHYRNLYQALDIPIQRENNRPGSLEALRSIKLAPEFQDKEEEELAISHCYLISQL
jgi:SAM-dependent methyltransferase